MSAIAQADREAADRHARGASLVFLNIPKLDALKARTGEHRTEYWDRGLHGFGVRVYANGREDFTVRYTLHGEQRRKDVGVYRNERGIVFGEIGYSDARAEAERPSPRPAMGATRSSVRPFCGTRASPRSRV